MSKQSVIKVLDNSIACFEGVAEILERKPTLSGILEVHDKCLDLKKAYENTKEKIGGQV